MRIPPDSIMPGTESILLNKKHGQHICQDLYGRAGFQLGVTRRGPALCSRFRADISRCQELEDKIRQLRRRTSYDRAAYVPGSDSPRTKGWRTERRRHLVRLR